MTTSPYDGDQAVSAIEDHLKGNPVVSFIPVFDSFINKRARGSPSKVTSAWVGSTVTSSHGTARGGLPSLRESLQAGRVLCTARETHDAEATHGERNAGRQQIHASARAPARFDRAPLPLRAFVYHLTIRKAA